MRKWTMAIALSVAALAGLATGCGKKQDPNAIRFRYWGDTAEIQIIENLLKSFMEANPGVVIKAERKNADNTYADILLQEFAANKAPDVMFVSTDNIELLAESNKLADLNTFLAKETDLKASDYYDSMIKRFSKNGQLLVLPRDVAPIAVVYYNKDIFDKAKLPYPKDDWTWDDLRNVAKKLTVRDDKGTAKQLGFADDWNLSDAWVLSGGGGMVDDYFNPTRFTVSEPDSAAGVLFRWGLFHKDRVMPTAADQQTIGMGAMALFMNGQLGLFHSGIWKTPTFRTIKSFKWDCVRFPTRKGVKNARFLAGGSGYTMRNDVANPELCWKLVKYLAGPEGQKGIASTGLAQPAIKSLAASEAFLDGQDPKNKKMLLEAAERGVAAPAWKPWQEFLRGTYTPSTDPIWLTGYKDGEAGVIKLLKDVEAQGNEKFFSKK